LTAIKTSFVTNANCHYVLYRAAVEFFFCDEELLYFKSRLAGNCRRPIFNRAPFNRVPQPQAKKSATAAWASREAFLRKPPGSYGRWRLRADAERAGADAERAR
jgi:hypothetical protein